MPFIPDLPLHCIIATFENKVRYSFRDTLSARKFIDELELRGAREGIDYAVWPPDNPITVTVFTQGDKP